MKISAEYVNLLKLHKTTTEVIIIFIKHQFLWSEATDGCNFGASIVVWDIVVVRYHDISISSIGESVTVGFVKMASSCRVTCGVVGKIRHQCRAGLCGWPTGLQGCTSRVSGIPINWISINSITKKSVWWSSCSSSNACSRNLKINSVET